MDDHQPYIPTDILTFYEIHNYRSAAQILATSCADEFSEILQALRDFKFTLDDIRKPGGNESDIPKRFSTLLRNKGWLETHIKGDLLVTKIFGSLPRGKKNEEKDELEEIEELEKGASHRQEKRIRNFIDAHRVDYLKNRVAFDLEWNSKDQTFDRDLYAFRAFYDCGLIDAAVLLTRSGALNNVFEMLGPVLRSDGQPKLRENGKPYLIKEKYGASTTWMGKLLYRLEAGRHGGCPVLAIGIRPDIITDWKEYAKSI